jgi:hypothetical protein
MSIKRNNKQIAGNYVNYDIVFFTEQVNSMKAELQNLYNATKNIIKTVNNPVGSECIWRANTPPENYIFMEGQLVSREDHIELYEWAIQNNIIVNDTDWQEHKKYGLYSHGDGETTFRIPNMTGFYFAGYDPDHHTGLGIQQEDMLPNLKGIIDIAGTNNSSPFNTSQASGVFKINRKETSSYSITGDTTLRPDNVENIELDISQAFNTGDRVQPKTIPVKYIVCYKDPRTILYSNIDYPL